VTPDKDGKPALADLAIHRVNPLRRPALFPISVIDSAAVAVTANAGAAAGAAGAAATTISSFCCIGDGACNFPLTVISSGAKAHTIFVFF
jgi:hypothetical protein